MKNFRNRIFLSLITGYILLYYAEIVFWATPDREGMGGMLVLTWIVYSIFAYVFLCVVSVFKARSVWAVFLAGACFGWFEEGIALQTTYGSSNTPFPMSISFTALAWHALIDVTVGWFLVRKILSKNSCGKTALLASAIGLFYGLWAIFWWTEPPEAMKQLFDAGRNDLVVVHFCVFAVKTTALLVVAHWLYDRMASFEFLPSKIELWTLGVLTLLYFAFITVPAAPSAVWVLPPLLGITLAALEKNRRTETRTNAIAAFDSNVKFLNYLMLFFIPLFAITVYCVAMALNASLRTNEIVYYVSTYAGAIMWFVSIVMLFGFKKESL